MAIVVVVGQGREGGGTSWMASGGEREKKGGCIWRAAFENSGCVDGGGDYR